MSDTKKSKSWIVWVIVIAVIVFAAGNWIANKDAKWKAEVKQHEKTKQESEAREKLWVEKEKELEKEAEKDQNYIAEIEEKHKEVLASRKWWADETRKLRAEIANMSENEKDKLLIEMLQKYQIEIEQITSNSIIITFTNREKLLSLIVTFDSQTNTIESYKTEVVTLKDKVQAEKKAHKTTKDIVITKQGRIKELLIQKKALEDAKTALKKRLRIQGFKNFTKKTLPAFIIGYVLAKFILN